MSGFENIIHALSYFLLPALIVGAVLVIVGVDFVFMKNPGGWLIVDHKGRCLTRGKGFISGVGFILAGILIVGGMVALVLYSATNVCPDCGEHISTAYCGICGTQIQ